MNKLSSFIKEKRDNKYVSDYCKQLINDPKFMSERIQLQQAILNGNIIGIPIGKP